MVDAWYGGIQRIAEGDGASLVEEGDGDGAEVRVAPLHRVGSHVHELAGCTGAYRDRGPGVEQRVLAAADLHEQVVAERVTGVRGVAEGTVDDVEGGRHGAVFKCFEHQGAGSGPPPRGSPSMLDGQVLSRGAVAPPG